MNRIVFSVLVLVIALATSCNQSSNSNSQSDSQSTGGMGGGNFNPEEMVERQMAEMKETLNLSDKQEKQMRELILENFDDMSKMREKSGGDREAMREQMQQLREEQNNKTKEILSDEQWEKYQTFQEERRGRRGQGRQERPE